ncbi:hypothetical protein NDU88_000014 [Pleurodeles waltl]|uniref:Uncharacterized protein n=1 Tax=Pleurodeles waltl TaxID=8319 RepID=A0AAV7R5H9_PLEWA|nr:hypothetical protein NDU88_000014 [Pleurodeles waltl]
MDRWRALLPCKRLITGLTFAEGPHQCLVPALTEGLHVAGPLSHPVVASPDQGPCLHPVDLSWKQCLLFFADVILAVLVLVADVALVVLVLVADVILTMLVLVTDGILVVLVLVADVILVVLIIVTVIF